MRISVALFALSILTCFILAQAQPDNAQSNKAQKQETRIQKAVREAQSKGHKKAVLKSVGEGAAMVSGIDHALRDHAAFIVTPVGSASSLSPSGEQIVTWYKFAIIGSLCKSAPVMTSAPSMTPLALLPV